MGISLNSVGSQRTTPVLPLNTTATRLPSVAAERLAFAPINELNAKRDTASVSSTGTERFGLSEIGSALEAPARISNSLAIADQALFSLGDLLGNINSTLKASRPETITKDQDSIDGALSNIDRLAGTTTFHGKKLLDGTFSTSLNGTTLQIPSFSTSTLGTSDPGTSANSLASLRTNGASTRRASSENQSAIVYAAIDQVSTTRQQIAHFQTHAVQPLTDAAQSALEHLIESPTIDTAGSAASNAILARAQGLLQPSATLGSFAPKADHVFDLLR